MIFACQQSENSNPSAYQCKTCKLYENDHINDVLAPLEGAVKPSHVSEIKSDSQYIPEKDELVGILKQDPKKEVSDPIRSKDLKSLSLKDQQIVSLLINQGHLFERNSFYVAHDGTILTHSNLEDFIYRFNMALNYQKNRNEENSGKKHEGLTEEDNEDSTANNTKSFSQIVSVLGAVGTFFWGYREWTANAAIMKQANADYQERMAYKQKFDEIDHAITPRKTDTGSSFKGKIKIPSPTKPKFGPLYAPSSAKFGKYVFSPLLIATSAILIGLSIEDIRN